MPIKSPSSTSSSSSPRTKKKRTTSSSSSTTMEGGENVWDISTWTTDIHWKDSYLHQHFEQLPFVECIHDILDLAETYFRSVYERYSADEHAEFDFPYLDILVLLTEEYLCGQFFHHVTPLQELQLLEMICRYFQENKLDPVRYFVFDCLFGLPCENLELQKSLYEHKLNILCKLTSIAIGASCGNVLNCIAVWMHTYGSQMKRAALVASAVMNDYCLICPKAVEPVKQLINVSPVFAYQFIVGLSEHYKDKPPDTGGEPSNNLPPATLVNVIADWIIEQPNFCNLSVPRVFLELPSIHKFQNNSRVALFRQCPLFSFIEWTLLQPLLKDKNIGGTTGNGKTTVTVKDKNIVGSTTTTTTNDQNIDSTTKSSTTNTPTLSTDHLAFSKLHYGFLNYISLQKKGDTHAQETSDDLEPGELLEELDNVELLHKTDIFYLINVTVKNFSTYAHTLPGNKEETINRLIEVMQVAKWAGCTSVPLKQVKPLLTSVPQTTLLEDFFNANK